MHYTDIGKKYAKQIAKKQAPRYVADHAKRGHVGKQPAGEAAPNPGTLTEIKQERHRLSVDERIDRTFEMAIEMAELAKKAKDYRTAATCLKEANSSTALMGKPTESGQLQQTINIDFSRFTDDELRTYATLGRKLEEGGAGSGEKTSN